MTSARSLRANRANAQLSTGPKIAAGRATAAKNARRHGLRVPVLADPALSVEVERIAQRIVGHCSVELIDLARRIAEAQVDLMRIRRARTHLIEHSLSQFEPQQSTKDAASQSSGGMLDDVVRKNAAGASNRSHLLESDGSDLFVGGFRRQNGRLSLERQMAILDRYEARALSRRKFAIHAFDDARTARAGTF